MVNLKNSLIIASLLLTACQGQNPFKRQSDPTTNYPHTMESGNRPYVPGQKPAAPAKSAIDAGKPVAVEVPCFDPIKIEVEPDLGNSLLKFAEETESAYDLKLTLNGPIGEIHAEKPENSELRLISRQDNIFIYRFTWKPASGTSAAKTEDMIIGFKGEPAKGACPNAKNRLNLSIVVSKGADTPSVSYQNMKEKITFGDQFDFKVIVDDPTASSGKNPSLKSVKGDAMEAVTSCKESKILAPTKFEFVCHFDSNLLKGIEKMLNTGKTGTASFAITAKSKAGVSSAATPQKIKVVFEKIETTKPATPATTAPAQGAKK